MMKISETRQPVGGGFTLVEILIVSSLLLLIIGGLLTILLTGQASYLSSDAYIQVQQEARRAFDSMVRELRESGRISCGAGAVTTTCTSPQLNFQVARSYTAGNVVWGSDAADNEYVHYALIPGGDTTQLVRYRDTIEGGAAPVSCVAPTCRVMANDVNAAVTSFTWDSDPADRTVTINLEIQYQNAALPSGGQRTGALTSRVRLRNPS
jgi:Tfp pilus assembly protein PilW